MTRTLAALAALIASTLGAGAQTLETSLGALSVAPVATGLEEPWAIGFLPGGDVLVTEREGRLLLLREGQALPVEGVPEVWDSGQGGLLDVMVPRDFAERREIWLSFAIASGAGGATAVGSGRLSKDGTRLEVFTVHWQGDGTGGGRHFGSRIVEGADGSIFVTTGDRGTRPDGLEAQDPMRAEGKVVRLNRDGSPAGAEGFGAGIYSIGHRNPQGAALDRDGALWVVEHGAKGGDELNRIEPGRNYGWPVVSYGENYGGGRIGEGTEKAGMEQPVRYWVPSIAPSGLMIYQGAMFPEWQGDLFTGSLNSDFISRLDPDAGFAEERITGAQTGRVRDVVEAPDGAIWFLSVTDGAIYRLAR